MSKTDILAVKTYFVQTSKKCAILFTLSKKLIFILVKHWASKESFTTSPCCSRPLLMLQNLRLKCFETVLKFLFSVLMRTRLLETVGALKNACTWSSECTPVFMLSSSVAPPFPFFFTPPPLCLHFHQKQFIKYSQMHDCLCLCWHQSNHELVFKW